MKLPWYAGFLPVVAVLIGMYALSTVYITLAIYHGGMILTLLLCKPERPLFAGLGWKELLPVSLACLATAPTVYFLWPWMHLEGLQLSELLMEWGLTGPMWLFVLFSVTLHPVLEEGFWRGRMADSVVSDLLFALFHVFVLLKIVHWPWALLCFAVLAVSAAYWRWVARRRNGLWIPIVSHATADLGIVLAVWKLM